MIAHVAANRGGKIRSDDPIFLQTCIDVLGSDTVKVKRDGVSITKDEISRLIKKHCGIDHKGSLPEADTVGVEQIVLQHS
jgi:hypothetical protein